MSGFDAWSFFDYRPCIQTLLERDPIATHEIIVSLGVAGDDESRDDFAVGRDFEMILGTPAVWFFDQDQIVVGAKFFDWIVS